MATISIDQLNDAVENGLNTPKWRWVIDGDDIVIADKDHPPTHELTGHWEYVKTIKEIYADNAPLCSQIMLAQHKR